MDEPKTTQPTTNEQISTEQAATQPQVVSSTPLVGENQQPTQRSKKPLWLVAVLIAVLLVGGAGLAYYLHNHKTKSAVVSSTNSTVATKTPTKQPTTASTLPAVTTAQVNGVTVSYLTLPITFSCASAGIGACSAVTSMGHFMALDTTGINYSQSINEGGKLIYDGKTVYSGPYAMYFGLSSNGQHYIYTLDTSTSHSGGNFEVYVDNKLVKTVPDTSNDVTYLSVSNNGKDYAYVTGLTGDQLVKDGTTIYTNSSGGINVVDFSADLSQYLASVVSGTDVANVVLNGKVIANNLSFPGTALPSISLSENGQHYLYTDAKAVYVDGKLVNTVKGVAAMAVTDTGAYGVVDALSNKLYVGTTAQTIPSQLATGCNPGCLNGITAAMNNDGSHYIIGSPTIPFWYLDGKQATLSGSIEGTEYVNDSLYVYRWTN